MIAPVVIHFEMPLTDHIVEAWQISSHAVEVRTDTGEHFRVTARRDMKAEEPTSYWAYYEEQVYFADIDGQEHRLWVQADFPYQTGKSIGECIRAALGNLPRGV